MCRFPNCVLPVLILACAVTAQTAPAAACSARISGPSGVNAVYAPFQPVDHIAEQRLTVENSGETECTFWLGIERMAGTERPGAALDFELRGGDGRWSSASAIAAPVWLAGRRIAPQESHDFTYSLVIPAGQVLPPGEAIHALDMVLRGAPDAGPPESAVPLDARTMRLSIAIQEHFSINIAGAGIRKTIDFGELTEGQQKEVRIETRSNQRFSLHATSLNGGVLAMAPPYERWQVPYSLVLDGKNITLPDMIGPFPGTGLAGQQLGVTFTIGEVRNKRAGLYTDEVTIEIKPAL